MDAARGRGKVLACSMWLGAVAAAVWLPLRRLENVLACSVWLGAVAAAVRLPLCMLKIAVANSGMAFDFRSSGAKSCGWHQRTVLYRPIADIGIADASLARQPARPSQIALDHQHADRHGVLGMCPDFQQRLGRHRRRLLTAAVEHAQYRRALGLGDGIAGGLSEKRFALVDRADQLVDGPEFDVCGSTTR